MLSPKSASRERLQSQCSLQMFTRVAFRLRMILSFICYEFFLLVRLPVLFCALQMSLCVAIWLRSFPNSIFCEHTFTRYGCPLVTRFYQLYAKREFFLHSLSAFIIYMLRVFFTRYGCPFSCRTLEGGLPLLLRVGLPCPLVCSP